jgi:pimeloyl-ACP methyl ester carboxylesterase
MVWLLLIIGYVLFRFYLYRDEVRRLGVPLARRRLRGSIFIMMTIYFAMLGILLTLEKKLVYHPASAGEYWSPPPGLKFEDLTLKSSTGDSIHAWWCFDPKATFTILFSHGNAGNLSGHSWIISEMRRWFPCNVMVYDYPGFGKSTGTPSEEGCYAAGQAAYQWLMDKKKATSQTLYFMGQSLGCAMACELANTQDHKALILLSPFTTIRDRGQEMMSIFPVRWLMTHLYDNRSKMEKYQKPLFIAHGTADEVIPFHHGKNLFDAAATKNKTFFTIDKGLHNDVPEGFFKALKEFITKVEAP